MDYARAMLLRCLGILVVVGFAVGCSKVDVASPARAPAQLDAKFRVRHLDLHIACRGEGHPPVVLDAGLGNDSQTWSAVIPNVARKTRVCAYDRAGMGSSSGPAPRPHSNQLMAKELHELLRAASVPEPYVLVGHSMGGANVRYLAAESPQSVVGVVLVDSMSEQQPARYWALLPETVVSEFRAGLASMPEGIDFDTFRDGLERLATVNPSLGKVPLVVLTSGNPMPSPPGVGAELEQQLEAARRSMQSELPRLSSNSVHVVVADAGHNIHVDQPDVVVAAINEVVDSVRQRRPLRRQPIARD
ncbi:MAG: alpha/beta hydrolase [Polyangiaceae bacterium]